MKNKKMLILLIIVNLVILLITCIFISGYKNIIREKQVIKEMTTSALEENLNAQITQLNKSHTDYANSIEESKKKIASAITEKGVATSNDVTLDTMADNIKNISGGTPIMIDFSYEYYGGDVSYRELSWTARSDCNVIISDQGNLYINGIEIDKSGYKFEYNERPSDISFPTGSYCVFDVKQGDVISMRGSYLVKRIVAFRYA